MNKCMAFDRKFLFSFSWFPCFKLSLMRSEYWNKRVGSHCYFIGLVGMFEALKGEYIAGLLLRVLGYRFYL